MTARLAVIKGEGIPETLTLPIDEPITIGRSKENQLVLCDISASRSHAEVRRVNDTWTIRDLSMNGTFVGSTRIDSAHQLNDGDVISIADMKIQFVEESSSQTSTKHMRLFLLDEMQALHEFTAAALDFEDPRDLIQAGLKTIYQLTRADLCGFLDVDDENPAAKIIYPTEQEVNAQLSQRLTKEVNDRRKTVRLKDADHLRGTGSVASLRDALCLPVLTEGNDFLGAVHVYKDRSQFSDGQIRFCEVLVSYATHYISRLRQVHSLTSENSRLREFRPPSDVLIGDSPAMQRVRALIEKVAPTDATVLLFGESGSGKEVVARQIHAQSNRNDMFLATNCASLPKDLMESQLYGHCKGSFSGATQDYPGMFQQADGGTLFLDEIGEMPLDCQPKFLRVLEGQAFTKLGGVELITTDTRIICATNKNLSAAVKAKEFRKDLYFRLNVLSIELPPLRDRIEDVPALTEHFLKYEASGKKKQKGISAKAIAHFQEYSWPGNVRELRNVLERAAILSDGDVIDENELQWIPTESQDLPASWHKKDVEAWHYEKVMAVAKGNISKAATIMGVNRETVTKKVKLYNLDGNVTNDDDT